MAIGLLSGCQGEGAVKLLKPPEVKRGSPMTLPMKQFDPTPWKQKTLKEKIPIWFKEHPASKTWWIDWDTERRPLKRLIIHHSVTTADASPEEIEGYTRRLYTGRYSLDAQAAGGNDPYVKGLPIHSAHVVDGKERFISYHHLVYPDGRVTTELQPVINIKDEWWVDMVGWHVGQWTINCESLGICLVGNYTASDPPEKATAALACLIAYYKTLSPSLVVEPHKQYRATECPGNTWDSWRKKLE